MAIKNIITEVDIESEHDGYLVVKRMCENNVTWLEIHGDIEYPFIIENAKDIDDLCKYLQEYKKLLK